MLKDIVRRNRSYRRFYGSVTVNEKTLRDLVDLARLTPSAANAQALRFRLVYTEAEKEKLFPLLHWAAALPAWGGPKGDEKPAAYIIILTELAVRKDTKTDVGIAAQTIMLGAVELGLGGCMMGAIERPQIAQVFGLPPEKYTVDLVLALGKPKETVKIVPAGKDGSVAYYRDADQIHYVPKRSLEDIIIK